LSLREKSRRDAGGPRGDRTSLEQSRSPVGEAYPGTAGVPERRERLEKLFSKIPGGAGRCTKFLRWRPDKDPKACTFEQVRG